MERSSDIPAGAAANSFATMRVQPLQYAYGLLLAICLNFVQSTGHDLQRVTELVFLFAAGCALAYRPFAAQVLVRAGAGIRWPLILLSALGILSSSLAFAPTLAFYETASLTLLLLLALVAADGLARERAALIRVLLVFGAVAALYAVKVVAVYGSVWLLSAVPNPLEFTPGFSNIRHFNHVETVGLPLLVLLYVVTPVTARLRMVWVATSAIWWSVLFATGGRGTEVGLIAGGLATLVMQRREAWPVARAMIVCCVIGVVVYELAFVLAPAIMGRAPFGDAGSVLARTMADPSSGRTILWHRAIELTAAHPWLGVGPLHFAHAHSGAAHPHNWMLQIASEWGLPALLALCAALAFAFRGLRRARTLIASDDVRNQCMLSAWTWIGVALVTDASVSGNIVMPQSQLMISLYIACATGWTWSLGLRPVPASSGMATALGRIAVIAASFALAYAVAPQLVDKITEAQPTAAELAVKGTSIWWPRLWRDGYF